MAYVTGVAMVSAVAVAVGWSLARRAASRARFAPGSLRRQYERCRESFRLDPFEVDNILNPVALGDEYRISGQRFRKRDVIVDIGAHVGVFTYLCHAKGSRAIYAYEPSSRNFLRLREHVGALPGVHCAQAAVWRSDTGCAASLHLSPADCENTGANSVLARGQAIDFSTQRLHAGAAEAEPVPAIPLDAILERFDRVKLLKLDCEGSEFPILLTSSRLDRVERIVGELHECGAEVIARLAPESRVSGYDEYRLDDLVRRLESLGFRIHLRQTSQNLWLFDARRTAP
jgi:FkbM family methyltransferase